jgi:hypothetical protein
LAGRASAEGDRPLSVGRQAQKGTDPFGGRAQQAQKGTDPFGGPGERRRGQTLSAGRASAEGDRPLWRAGRAQKGTDPFGGPGKPEGDSPLWQGRWLERIPTVPQRRTDSCRGLRVRVLYSRRYSTYSLSNSRSAPKGYPFMVRCGSGST